MAQNWDLIRRYYADHSPAIVEAGKNNWGIDPYMWESVMSMTPIERAFWNDIREEGCVLYPNYPVGRFFVDFANPCARVAIECDGKLFHQDHDKDAARQAEIESMGWRVFRIAGRQCMELDRFNDDSIIESFSAGRHLLRDLCQFKPTNIRVKAAA